MVTVVVLGLGWISTVFPLSKNVMDLIFSIFNPPLKLLALLGSRSEGEESSPPLLHCVRAKDKSIAVSKNDVFMIFY